MAPLLLTQKIFFFKFHTLISAKTPAMKENHQITNEVTTLSFTLAFIEHCHYQEASLFLIVF